LIKKLCCIQSRLLWNLNKSCGIQLRHLRFFFFNITKFVGIRLRFLKTYKMSHGIQKSTYFNRFFCELDFVGLLVKITKKMFIKQSLQNPWDCVRLSWNQFCRDRVPFLVFFLRLIVHVLMNFGLHRVDMGGSGWRELDRWDLKSARISKSKLHM
jgi:hypothetical protein